MELSVELEKWRCDRPDEWKMDEFIRNAVKLEQELAALKEQMRWRSVEDEPANDGDWYIVRAYRESSESMMTTIAFCDKDSETGETVWLPHDSMVVFDYDTDVMDVTHWMPLPTHPTT